MSQFQATAEMVYLNEGSYNSVSCAHSELISFCGSIKDLTGKEPSIHSSRQAYCIYTELPGGNYYCLDDSSFTVRETAAFPGNPGYCDGATFICP